MIKQIPRRILTGLILVLSSGALIVGVVFLTPSLSPAKPTNITWTPSQILTITAPGESETIAASFSSSKRLKNVNVTVAPELQPYLRVEPNSFSSIAAGELVIFTLVFTPPADAPLGTFNGTIQITKAKKPTKPIGSSLPITLEMGKKLTYNNFSVQYPTFGQSSHEGVRVKGGDITFDIKVFSAAGQRYISQFGFTLHENSDDLSLTDWFLQRIDPNESLLSGGIFTKQTFLNGMDVLIRVAPIPDEYLEQYGPVADFYGISPDSKTIVILSKSQVNELDLYGYTEGDQQSLLLSILQSMRF